jgi:4-aminobutyrate aminotransferase-like enzyme
MTRVLHRAVNRTYSAAESGSGSRLRDSTGKQQIDASGGAAVSCLGHPDLLAAMRAQLDRLAYAHSNLLHHAPGRGVGASACRAGAARHVATGAGAGSSGALKSLPTAPTRRPSTPI